MKKISVLKFKVILFIQSFFILTPAAYSADAWWRSIVDSKKLLSVLPELVEMAACSPLLKGKTRKIVHACIFMTKAGQILVKLRPDGVEASAQNEELVQLEALDPLDRQQVLFDLLSRTDFVGPSLAVALSLKSSKTHELLQVYSAWRSSIVLSEPHQKQALQIMILDAALRFNDQKTFVFLFLGENPDADKAAEYLRERWDSKSSDLSRTVEEVSNLGKGLPDEAKQKLVAKLMSFSVLSESKILKLLLKDLPNAKRSLQIAIAVGVAQAEQFIRDCQEALNDMDKPE